MSFTRWIALVVIALGLQVPGRLTFRVCLCEGLLGAGLSYSHDCLPAAPTSCCDEEQEREAPRGDARCDRDDGCRCVLVHVPPRADTAKVTPNATPSALLGEVTMGRVVASIAGPKTRVDVARTRAHDPPWERANLPLRI